MCVWAVGACMLARQMGAQKWGICRTSSITEVVMQMKYTMGKEKTVTGAYSVGLRRVCDPVMIAPLAHLLTRMPRTYTIRL